MMWSYASRRILLMISVYITAMIVHAFTPIVTNPIYTLKQTNIHPKPFVGSLHPLHHRSYSGSTFLDGKKQQQLSALYMSDADTNPNESDTSNQNKEPTSTAPIRTMGTSANADIARTSSVFLLEPNDPFASLSASPYTFPSKRQLQQTKYVPYTGTTGTSTAEGRLNPNTASMLVVTSSSSSSQATPTQAYASPAGKQPQPQELQPLTIDLESRTINELKDTVADIGTDLEQPTESVAATGSNEEALARDTTTALNPSESRPPTMATDHVESAQSFIVEEDMAIMDELLEEVVAPDDVEDETEVVVALSEPQSAKTTAAASEKEPEYMNEDQKVINDLFIINDVFGIDPLTTMQTGAAEMELLPVVITETISDAMPMNDVDENNNVQLNNDDMADVSNDITVDNDNDDTEIAALQIDISKDDDDATELVTNGVPTATLDIDPLATMKTGAGEAELLPLEITDTISDSMSMNEVDENNDVQLNIDDMADVSNAITVDDNDDIEITAVQIDTSKDDDDDATDQITNLVASAALDIDNEIVTTNDVSITITDGVDVDEDRIVVNGLFEVLEDSAGSEITNLNSIDFDGTVADDEMDDEIEATVAEIVNEVVPVEVEMNIESSKIDDLEDIPFVPLSKTIAAEVDDNLAAELDMSLPMSDIDIADAAKVDAIDNMMIQNIVDSPTVDTCEAEDVNVEIGASLVDPIRNAEVNESQRMDSTLVGEIDLETSGTYEMTMYDDDVNVKAVKEDWDGQEDSTKVSLVINASDIQDVGNVAIEEGCDTQETIKDPLNIRSNDTTRMENAMFDVDMEQNGTVEPTLTSGTATDDALEPFFLRYDNENNVAKQELIVKPPSTPPQLSDFTRYQSTMIAMTREERIASAEQSFLSLEIKPGVKTDTIKGAAIATFMLALLAGDEIPVALLGMVPAVSYFAVTRGKTGETIRIIGDLSWLWTSKFAETLSSMDPSQLIAFWNAMQSITSKFWTSFGVWMAQQSTLAEEEYYQKQSAAATINDPQQTNNEETDYYFISTMDQRTEIGNQEMQVSTEVSQSERTYEKELEGIQLLLEEADRECIAAKIRCEQKVKESYQRQLLATKLDMDRRSAQRKQSLRERESIAAKRRYEQKVRERYQRQLLATKLDMDKRSAERKQALRDFEEARLEAEEKINRQKVMEGKQRSLLACRLALERIEIARVNEMHEQTNRKLSEAKQRSLLETRLKLDRQHKASVNETRRLLAELDQKRNKEAKQRSIFEYRLSLERRMAAQSKISAQRVQIGANNKMAEIKQRSLLEARLSIEHNQKILRAEMEAVARIEDENLLAEAAELARVQEDERGARIEKQIRLEEESRLAERSRIEAMAEIEAENRRAEDARLRAEIEEIARIESEKCLAEATERARLESLDDQTRLNEATQFAEISRIEDLAPIEEEPVVQDVFPEGGPSMDINNLLSKPPVSTEGMKRENSVSTRELPWADSRSAANSAQNEIQKPNLDAAKALLESVRKGESYQFKKEWWE